MSAIRWKTDADRGRRFDKDIKHDPVLRALFETLFDQEKRLRVLEGKPPLSKAQARAALRSRFARTG